MLAGVVRFFSGPPQETAKVATSSWAAAEMLKGLRVGFGELGVAAAVALAAVGAISYWRRAPRVLALFVLPGALTGAAMVVLHAPIRPRFFFMMAGFGLLMLVRGATVGAEALGGQKRAGWLGRAADLILAIVAVASLWSLGFNYRYPKQDFTGARQYVDAARRDGDGVGTAGLAIYPFEHYDRRSWTPLETRDDFDALTNGRARAWVVYSFPEYMDPQLVTAIRERCRTPKVFPGTLGGGDVVVCLAAR
jgi:hypothetical protein